MEKGIYDWSVVECFRHQYEGASIAAQVAMFKLIGTLYAAGHIKTEDWDEICRIAGVKHVAK